MLLGAVAIVALCVTALINAAPAWVTVFYTAAVVVLLLASCRALATCGRTRAFWAAFAVCGGAYFCLTLTTLGQKADYGGWTYPKRQPVPRLLTEALLHWMHEALPPLAASYAVGSDVSVEWHGSWWPATILEVKGDQYNIRYIDSYAEWVTRARIRNASRDFQSFVEIGDTMWALLIGLCGALAARYWWRPAGDSAPQPSPGGKRERSSNYVREAEAQVQ
jgi:hypothetical protein